MFTDIKLNINFIQLNFIILIKQCQLILNYNCETDIKYILQKNCKKTAGSPNSAPAFC